MKSPKQVSHILLHVSDLSSTIAFYRKFFRTDPVKQREQYAKFSLEKPALVISFVQSRSRINPDFGHLGIRLDSEDELYDRLRQAKYDELEIREEFGTKCCYALLNKFWVTDPDGYQWEVYNFIDDVEENDPQYQFSSDAECCAAVDDCCTDEPCC